MATNQSRAPHKGERTRLVVAIDIGTTFSGVAYTFLIPGQVPKVYCVTGYEGQEDQGMSTKVPTVLYYNEVPQLVACGSEPIDEDDEANECLTKVEWFKLLMRPSSWTASLSHAPSTSVPEGLGVVDLVADFLHYLARCLRGYIFQTHVDGKDLWEATIGEATFILTHPNGWEGFQQGQMRQAAIKAGLVPDAPEGRARIEFLTEGEASLHWCVSLGLTGSSLSTGSHVIVADAGGGTIDVSCFRVSNASPLQLEEASPAQCRVAGSIFVTQAFERVMIEKLGNSKKWGTSDRLERLVEEFDKKAKCIFREDTTTTYVRLGTARDNDPGMGIRLGKLGVSRQEVLSTFERSCNETTEAILFQLQGRSSSIVFLVGGFAASPWLYEEVKRRLHGQVRHIHRAESQTAKAVAHGALVHYLDQAVTKRIAKHTYGTGLSYRYDASKASHKVRQPHKCPTSGTLLLGQGFKTMVEKGDVITTNATYRTSIERTYTKFNAFRIDIAIKKYLGSLSNVEFLDMDSPTQFVDVCKFSALMPARALQERTIPTQKQYWVACYDVVINLGTAELQCYVEWTENGEKTRSLAASTWEDV